VAKPDEARGKSKHKPLLMQEIKIFIEAYSLRQIISFVNLFIKSSAVTLSSGYVIENKIGIKPICLLRLYFKELVQ
jgi:hypothetical protein